MDLIDGVFLLANGDVRLKLVLCCLGLDGRDEKLLGLWVACIGEGERFFSGARKRQENAPPSANRPKDRATLALWQSVVLLVGQQDPW
jgi:hypothetical protein